MRCQYVCPENKPYIKNITAGSSFSEEETDMILHKTTWEKLETKTREKLEDIRGIYPLMVTNLNALIEKQRKATKTELFALIVLQRHHLFVFIDFT